MRVRKLDSNRDMSFGQSANDFLVDSPQAVAQMVMTRLQLFAGEWFLDTTEGLPVQSSVLGFRTLATVLPAIRARILDTENVVSIVSLSSDFDATMRKIIVSGEITTTFGDATIGGVI